MKKQQQRDLINWLKQQSLPAKKWLRLLTIIAIFNAVLIVAQAWLLASILHQLIIEHVATSQLHTQFFLLIFIIILKSILLWAKEKTSFYCGMTIRQQIRQAILDRLTIMGPATIKEKLAGSWATMLLEQVEDMQDYYARYLPQMAIAATTPLFILAAIYPINWAAGIILTFTAPLIPLFMIIVGLGAAEANQRNFLVLSRLGGIFLDRLKGLDTLRLFFRAAKETQHLEAITQDFRIKTMDVLKIAFLSSAILEFFASVSIAIVAVYFGFSYLGDLNFGHYGLPITLFSGFLTLILAPEFFQPLRDLGSFYHAKAQAIGAADSLYSFLNATEAKVNQGDKQLTATDSFTICANSVVVLSSDGYKLTQPLNFTIDSNQRIALVGHSGAGKSSIFNLLLGFLPYQGSLKINGIEFSELQTDKWQQHISWIGQNPFLPAKTIRENITLSNPSIDDFALQKVVKLAAIDEFLPYLADGLETVVGDNSARLSVGQAQRIAVARALLEPCKLLLLDEPCASLDANSENFIMQTLTKASQQQTTLLITHRVEDVHDYDVIWVMAQGDIVQKGSISELSTVDGPFIKLMKNHQQEI